MSDEGEKSCPLCAEDMDMTDQQLKPCKCGYEICVWCWHHIMDMAEKDATEGRCPACRTPYNKEKIVGTTAKCDRLVSEMSVEKRLKSQKGKSKTLEGRKQLSSVRVVQRNLVYIVGLPLDFADEDLLQGREYFEQYGKVMKVSISRTAAGAIQQFPNSTCSVYITYSKEEEAVRCIQSVHGFVLDGRPLRACFGTTKYCHAWLRNMPCSNPDCLYLHEIGSQEDSFTKDEIISAYTRVQQITSSSNMQRRSGNVLPPPADDYCNNSSAFTGKPVTTTSINTNQNLATSATISPSNSNSGRSAALPAGASWGTRTSSNQTLSTSTACFSAPLKQKLDSCNGSVAFSTTAASTNSVSSLHSDSRKKSIPNEGSTNSQHNSKMETFESIKKESNTDVHFASLPRNRQPHSPPANKRSPNTIISDSSIVSSGPALDEHDIDDTDGNVENVSHDILSMSVHESRQLQDSNVEHIKEPQTSGKATNMTEEASVVNTQTDFRLGMSIQVPQVDMHDMEDDLLSFHNQRIKDPEVAINRVSDLSHAIHLAKHSNIHSPQLNNLDKQVVERTNNLLVSPSNFPSGRAENIFNSLEGNDVEYSSFFPNKEKRSLLGRCEGEVTSNAADMGESSLISNIFSLDLDSWDESITSPRDMVKLLGETDRRQGSFGAPGQRRVQNSSQSRFSFAREEEPISQVSDFGQSIDYFGQAFKQGATTHDFSGSNNFHHEKFSRSGFGQSIFSGTEEDTFASGHSHISSNKLSVSRSQMSAPPGFSAPSRAPPPPPGFTSHERTDQFFDTLSGNHMFDASSLLRNQYQTPSSGNAFSNNDIEFMDPAILAVGKGTLPGGINSPNFDIRSNFPPQLSTRYEDARFQSFLQRSNSIHQNQRFTDLGDNFSNGYGIPSRVMEQSFSNNLSPFSQFTLPQSRNGITSNGQWDGWNEGQNGNNNLGMADLLRNERLGFNRFYGGYEDSKIRMPSSGNLYNGTYGI